MPCNPTETLISDLKRITAEYQGNSYEAQYICRLVEASVRSFEFSRDEKKKARKREVVA